MKNLFVATVIALFFATSARADMCDGPITSVAVQDDGGLNVNQANKGHWVLCSVSTDRPSGGITAATCRSWLAMLMAAQKAGVTVRLYTHTFNCSAPSDWVAADVYFLEDLG